MPARSSGDVGADRGGGDRRDAEAGSSDDDPGHDPGDAAVGEDQQEVADGDPGQPDGCQPVAAQPVAQRLGRRGAGDHAEAEGQQRQTGAHGGDAELLLQEQGGQHTGGAGGRGVDEGDRGAGAEVGRPDRGPRHERVPGPALQRRTNRPASTSPATTSSPPGSRCCGCSASEAPKIRAITAATSSTAPTRSSRVAGVAPAATSGLGARPRRPGRAPTGRFTQNTARQLNRSVSTPPTRNPSAPAAAPAGAPRRQRRPTTWPLGCRVEQQPQRRWDTHRGGRALQSPRHDQLHDVLGARPDRPRPRRSRQCRSAGPDGGRNGHPAGRRAPAARRRTWRRPSPGSGWPRPEPTPRPAWPGSR